MNLREFMSWQENAGSKEDQRVGGSKTEGRFTSQGDGSFDLLLAISQKNRPLDW